MAKEWNIYLNITEAKATKEQKEQQEHIQQVTNQNATLVTMIQEPQKKLKELMTTSKNLLEKMAFINNKEQSEGNGVTATNLSLS